MSHQVLARKWRPRRFEEVVSQDHVVQALRNSLDNQQLHHALLFTGTRGVGKTTLARIFAKCLNCQQAISATPCEQCDACLEIDAGRFVDLIEVDAASRTKVEDTRELLDNIQYAPTKGRFKVYLIDEVHMLSGHSFNALLKTLEEPPEHVKFLLATTDPQRLPATILSRCLQFHLLPMPPENIAQHLQHILNQEQISFEPQALELLAKAADGSMRDALSLLDQSIAYGNGKVLSDDIKKMLGLVDNQSLLSLLVALKNSDPNALLTAINQLTLVGVDFKQALGDLLGLFHQIAILQFVPDCATADAELKPYAKDFSPEDVQLYYQIGLMGQRDLALAPNLKAGFEMTLLRMLAFKPVVDATPTTKTQQMPARPATPVSANAPTAQVKPQPQLEPINIANAPTPAPAANQSRPLSPLEAEWAELLAKLQLTGPTHALAQHCSLKSINAHELELLLDTKQALMMNDKHSQRITEALTKHFQRPITVHIHISETPLESTPYAIDRQAEKARQQAAEHAITSNQQVRQIIQAFDATIVKESIVPNEH